MADTNEGCLRKVLVKVAEEQKYNNADLKVTLIPPTGSNFTSQLFRAVISATNHKDLELFGKVAALGEGLRAQAPTKIFKIERHVYSKLAKIYKDIEDEHNVATEHRLFLPKYYGSSDAYLEEVIVLQDLGAEGFTTHDRLEPIDWEYASKAVEELAKLHALSIAYRKEYPEDYEEAKDVLKRELPAENTDLMATVSQMVDNLAQGVREENREKFKKFMAHRMGVEAFAKFYVPRRREVLIHSDFRQSNLMHRVHKDGSLQVMIVDYQTVHAGCAATDLLYFIFTGSDGRFRRNHYSQLIDHYYSHVSAALMRLDVDPDEVFPREDFDEDLKDSLPFGLLIAGLMLPMITMEAATAPAPGEAESFEAMAELLMSGNDLCAKLLNEVVDEYVEWGLL